MILSVALKSRHRIQPDKTAIHIETKGSGKLKWCSEAGLEKLRTQKFSGRRNLNMTKQIRERNGSKGRRLEGKVAIITGAGTGIGEAIAHKFAKEGARLIVNGLPDDPIADVAQSIREKGGDAIPKAGDVSDENAAWGCINWP